MDLKTSILAALANGALLVFTCGIIATDAMYKLFSPTEVQAVSVMIVAAIGIVVNFSTALLFYGAPMISIFEELIYIYFMMP